MKIQKIETEKAPKPIGSYSQAIQAEQFVFVSGQIAIDPSLGKIIHHTIEEQTTQVLNNVHAILTEAKLTFANVVKTEIFLKNMNHFKTVNEIYSQYFSHDIKPARQVLEVARLPLDALIEISCIALRIV